MKPDKIFDIYSENYDVKFNSNPVTIYQRGCVHHVLKPILANAKTLLDVGCGPGSDFEFYTQFDIKITAFDISPKMVQLAQKKSESINLDAKIYNSSIELFETENKFDVILLNFGVVNVFPKLTENLEKLEMLLEENGKLIIVSMPSFHLFSVLGNIFRIQLKKLYSRLILEKSILENGFEFYFYSRSDFNKNFKIITKCNLCSILPTPDQYAKNKFLRFYFKVLWRIDKCFGNYLPAFLGGDHILFELEKK
jgi:ubiquinone/menaquinone biosynthesis C-methylase UbiE